VLAKGAGEGKGADAGSLYKTRGGEMVVEGRNKKKVMNGTTARAEREEMGGDQEKKGRRRRRRRTVGTAG